MRSAKIIVTGPARAGTTTLIRSLSEIAVLSTERKLNHGIGQGRGEATVALDFGRVTINRDLVLYLFGTPGDEPASLAEGPLAEGPLGLIVSVDVTRPQSLEGAAEIIDFLGARSNVPFVVAANKLAPGDDARMAAVRDAVHASTDVPVVACNVTERESSKRVVLALIDRILDKTPPASDVDAGAEQEAE
jgi:signal recognition particle receptor subunit beta